MSSLPASPPPPSSSASSSTFNLIPTPHSTSASSSTSNLIPTPPSTSSPPYNPPSNPPSTSTTTDSPPNLIDLEDIYDEITSLPDSGTSDDIDDDSSSDGREESDAEREWKESLQQLELLLTMVVVPYVGKYFGRKCAYWSWAKLMEWKYPSVEVVVTSKTAFRTAGAVGAAASL